jgi:guanosine-3',5'-bis(diphosphate) 3'-pyrophosphohydrolase
MNLDLTLYDSSENLWIDFEKSLKLWKLDKEPMIKKAFELALKMHTGQKRKSGHDYVVHPCMGGQGYRSIGCWP